MCFRWYHFGSKYRSLFFSRGIANAHIYKDHVLSAYMRSYTNAIGNNFLLQGNNSQLDDWITDYVYEGIEQHPSSHFRAYFTATTERLVSTSTVWRRHHEGGV